MMSKQRRKSTKQDKLLDEVKQRGSKATANGNLHDGHPPYEVVLVTPDMAIKWLEGNVHNRELRQKFVDIYTAEMKAGRWRLTHQGIAFDTRGTLIDGQHRLWAVVESKVSVKMAVHRGLPIDTQYVIDTGQVRQVHDTLTLMDVFLPGSDKTRKLHTAIMRWLVYGTQYNPSSQFSALQGRECIERYGDAVAWSLARLGVAKKRLTTAPVYAAVARAYFNAEHERLAEFCHVLRSGLITDPADGAAIRLRETLLAINGAGREIARTRYLKTERAIRAFLDRSQIQRIYAADDELFPLPGEKAAPRKRSAAK